jgi:histone H3/H4
MEKITLNAPSHEELANIAKSCGIILCRRGHEASKEAVHEFVSDLISDSLVLAQYASRTIILARDVIYSLRISSNRLCNQLGTFYGSCNEFSDAESEEDEDMDYIPPSHSDISEGSSEATASSSVSDTTESILASSSEEAHFIPMESVELDGFSVNSTSMKIFVPPEVESPLSLASIADIINVHCRKRSIVIRIQMKALEVLKDVVTHHLYLSYSGQLRYFSLSIILGDLFD